MQCVKVGSMEIHLNIFPLYVLLLLLSLSHGRPPHGGGNHSSLPDGGVEWRARDEQRFDPNWDDPQDNELDDDDEDDDQFRFRNNILRELGLENAYIPTTPQELTISKEEYMAAYVQYMSNVRRRKEAAWTDMGPKRRRKNAITRTQVFISEGVQDEIDRTTTFHFDINSQKLRERDIRVRRAQLVLPKGCRPLVNATRLTSGEEGNYDLTTAMISWLFAPNPSPSFQLIASCNFSFSSGSLRLVTSELPKSRNRRSAPNSTLQSFKVKPRAGIDCTKTRRGKSCCRRSLKIKFTDLGISEVIIEPQEFDAHVCVGRCNAKRVGYSSTHAMFQHVMHQTKGKGVAPRPCCTPTKLTELDVIHVNSANPNKPKLEVTVLKDAIVQECGCS